MSRKQNIHQEERDRCQKQLKKLMLRVIKNSGLLAAEYQIQWLSDHPKADLPTSLNHRETVREYWLIIKEYKEKLQTIN